MPNFGKRSIENLSQAHLDLQLLFHRVIQIYDCSVICGHRGQEAQDEAFFSGTSKKRWPHGNHNKKPSTALDVVPFPVRWPKKRGDAASRRMIYFGGLVKGIAAGMGIGIRWGGDWDGDNNLENQNFHDLPHFEISRLKTHGGTKL